MYRVKRPDSDREVKVTASVGNEQKNLAVCDKFTTKGIKKPHNLDGCWVL